MLTASECAFESYCKERGIVCRRVPAREMRTPDYEITIDSKEIKVEIKELDPTQEDLESERLLKERGYGTVLSRTPGERVRRSICAARGQLKQCSLDGSATLLVLYDRGRGFDYIDPNHIWAAMYGHLQLHLAVPPITKGSPYVLGSSAGPDRLMAGDRNTSFSAIGALFYPAPDQTGMIIYHNQFARVPLDPALFARHAIHQYFEDGRLGATKP
jgi:hypothetical protein